MPLDLVALQIGGQSKVSKGDILINVKDYGATGDGVTDDTAAIDTAFAVSGQVYFPAGNFKYSGTGYTGDKPVVRGHSRQKTTITLGTGCSILTRATTYTNLEVSGITFMGGFGAVRHSYTGTNTLSSEFEVHHCNFKAYTGAAISTLSIDMPYWKIHHNMFDALDYVTTIGVCLGGNTDLCTITDNEFLRNRVHIKVTKGGNNMHIRDNDFIRWTNYVDRARTNIWVVPHTASDNSGAGFVVSSNKFGNENFESGDYLMLYADEDPATGADRATRFPLLSADSTGYITGHRYADNLNNGSTDVPLVYSTTPEIRGCHYSGMIGGTAPRYIIEYRTTPPASVVNTSNVIGPFMKGGLSNSAPTVISNGVNVGTTIDPTDLFSSKPDQPMRSGGGDIAGLVSLMPTSIAAFTVVNSATRTGITDSLGSTDAAELFFPINGAVYATVTPPTIGTPIWVEFDLGPGASSPVSEVQVSLAYPSPGEIHWRRSVAPPTTGWQRYRFLTYVRELSTTLRLVFNQRTGQPDNGQVKVGRVRVYHNREPVNFDGALRALNVQGNAAVSGSLTVGGLPVGAGSNPYAITTGEETLDRRFATSNTLILSNGVMRLSYFYALKTETVNNVTAYSGSIAGSGVTHAQVGVYSVDVSGNLTLIANTTDDITMFAGINGTYARALSGAVSKVAGNWYAIGILVASTTTQPNTVGSNNFSGVAHSIMAEAPRLSGSVGVGLTAVPASVSSGGVLSQAGVAYSTLTP